MAAHKTTLPDLPRELLIQIFEYLVPQLDNDGRAIPLATEDRWYDQEESAPYWHLWRLPGLKPESQLLSTLLICHAFYLAGLKAIYSHRLLRFNDASDLQRFTRKAGEARRSCVRSIVVGIFWNEKPQRSDADVLASDHLAALPLLQSAVVVYATREAFFGDFKHEYLPAKEQQVKDAWRSKADVLRFVR